MLSARDRDSRRGHLQVAGGVARVAWESFWSLGSFLEVVTRPRLREVALFVVFTVLP